MYNILIVEDDDKIRKAIELYFRDKANSDIKLSTASDGDMALDMIYETAFDLIILDVMLPGADGFTICKTVRRDSTVPIIFLTAKGSENDILHGYDLGCDDYIVKPFSVAILYSKVTALINRSKGTVLSNDISVGSISLNPRTMVVKVNESEIYLPQKQYLILKVLIENSNSVITRQSLLTRIWGYDYDCDERILDNHIKKLRKALGAANKQIKTVIGKGYKLVD